MAKTKVSDKYQVVIPKSIREQINLKEGQSLNAYVCEDGVLLLKDEMWPQGYIGSQQDFWASVDVAHYLKDERDSWE